MAKHAWNKRKEHHAEDDQKDDSENENDELDIEACVEEYGSSLTSKMGEEAEGWKALVFLSTATPAIVTMARSGSAAYREEFDLLYRREASHSIDYLQSGVSKPFVI